jgi:prevent-host-death family protein
MAADQGIRVADDGVAEVSMTSARANLTQLLRDVRYGKRPGAFTERGERSAYVVPPDFYDQALRDRAVLELLRKRAEEASTDPHPTLQEHARTVRDWLADTEASIGL